MEATYNLLRMITLLVLEVLILLKTSIAWLQSECGKACRTAFHDQNGLISYVGHLKTFSVPVKVNAFHSDEALESLADGAPLGS